MKKKKRKILNAVDKAAALLSSKRWKLIPPRSKKQKALEELADAEQAVRDCVYNINCCKFEVGEAENRLIVAEQNADAARKKAAGYDQ